MKNLIFFTLAFCFAPVFPQDSSYSKPGKMFYTEMQNPVKADISEWSELNKDVYVSFADDNFRYPKEKVPHALNSNKWEVSGWKGEKIHTQILVWTKTRIPELRYETKDLAGNGGSNIGSDNIKPGFVRYVMTDEFGKGCGKRKASEYDSSLVEDPVDIIDVIPVEPYTVQPVWISIEIPYDIPAGRYSGILTIVALKDYKMKINLTVLDRLLPPAGEWKFDLDLWQSAMSIAKVHDVKLWSEEHFQIMGPYFEMLANAGQKSITANIIDQPWGKGHVYYDDPTLINWTKKKDGSWSYDYSVFDRYVEKLISCGIDKRINCYTMVTWDLSFIYFDESLGRVDTVKNARPGSDIYSGFWTPMLTDFTKHLKQKNWFEKTAIAMDEREVEAMEAVIGLLRKIDPDWKVALAGDYHPEIVRDVYDYCLNIGQTFPQKLLAWRKDRNLPSTYYTACGTDIPNGFSYSSPAENLWICWYASAAGFSGYLRWAYNNWNKAPLLDSRFRTWPAGDLYQIYPGPRTSIRFEKFIEGIQDFEKIRILREEFTKNGNTGGNNELDEILCPFNLNKLKGVDLNVIIRTAKLKLNKL
jgi:hypothetical protein